MLKPDEVQELALKCYENPALFNRTFLPDWFSHPMPWVHRGMIALLSKKVDWLLEFGEEEWPAGKGVWDEKGLEKILNYFGYRSDPDDPKSPMLPLFRLDKTSNGKPGKLSMYYSDRMLFIMPRGISKTTLINADNIKEICYHDNDFLVYLSETGPHAATQLDTVKRQLEGNEAIIQVFGNKKPERNDPEHWSSHMLQTTDGVTVVARGRGGQVRGLNVDGKRPSRIIFDDVEDTESVKTDEQRAKTRQWFTGDVVPALPIIQGSRSGQIIGAGTVLHGDALIINIAKDPEWITVWFGAKDPSGQMLWDKYLTEEQYNAKKRSFIRLGQRSQFRLEFDSSARPEAEQAKFDESYIRYEPRGNAETVARAIVVDPAISDKKGSDFCSFAVVGITEKGIIHLYDVRMEVGMKPQDQVDMYFKLHFLYDCTRHGVEAISYQKALVHLLKEEMFRRGKTYGMKSYFEIDEITHGKTGKVERVEGILAPRYSAGYITHQRRFPEYEEQLLDWPNGKKDGPDAVAMAVALLDPFAAYAHEDEIDGSSKLTKDQYKPLREEFGKDWRRAP